MIKFSDFIASRTAKAKKINNTPTDKTIIENINKTIVFLNSLDLEISINSAYRCKLLNDAVGGTATSHHLSGYAADITS